MRKNTFLGCLSVAALLILGGCASTIEIGPVPSITPKPEATPTPSPIPTEAPDDPNRKDFKAQYEETGVLKSMSERYDGYFDMGVAVSREEIEDETKRALITEQFDTITCLYELTPIYIFDQEATLASGDKERVVIDFSGADVILKYAQENGKTVRGSALVTYNRTPDWFFTPDFVVTETALTRDTDGDGVMDEPDYSLASAEVMEARLENLIKDVMEYCNTNYPGVVVSWDLVEEVIAPTDGHALKYRSNTSDWARTMGDDYIFKAYEFGRKYAAEGQKLFYSEYQIYEIVRRTPTVDLVQLLVDKGLIDGMAVQGHWSSQSPNMMAIEEVFKPFFAMGIEVHVSELDINMEAMDTDDSERTLDEINEISAKRWKNVFNWFVRMEDAGTYDFTNVTIYGLTDDASWYNQPEEGVDENGNPTITVPEPNYPVLFDEDLNPKDAFFGSLLDESIKMY